MGYDMYTVQTPSEEEFAYFRLNIWGMRAMRDAIRPVLDDHAKYGEWPKIETDDDGNPINEAEEKRKVDFLSTPSSDENKVPTFKFCSNDGWIVTPAECEVIASYIETAEVTSDDADWVQYVKRFGQFNRRATKLGGYRVY